MKPKLLLLFVFSTLFCGCSTTFYVVRHAEKSTSPKDDPILTEKGFERAEKLKEILRTKGIEQLYSTQTKRTVQTAEPLSNALSTEILIYDAKKQTEFIQKLKQSNKNTLIVGHSNTLHHLVNGLAEKNVLPTELQDSEYDNLFKIKRRKLGKPQFETIKF